MKLFLDSSSVDLNPISDGYSISVDGKAYDVKVLASSNGEMRLLVDGKRINAVVSQDGVKRWVTINGRTHVITKSAGKIKGGHAQHASGELIAPMPGVVRAVNVNEGETVVKGQTLIILEAMKMEIKIAAPKDGVVDHLLVKQGQIVERDQLIVKIV
jgi:acetyl/propionyl-CoA carboxylase alpha subunit